jgi:hypothetical protein
VSEQVRVLLVSGSTRGGSVNTAAPLGRGQGAQDALAVVLGYAGADIVETD